MTVATGPGPAPDDSASMRQAKRTALRMAGRFMRANRQEFNCTLIDISTSGLAVNTDVVVDPGERIVAVFDRLGTLPGKVVRIMRPGFGPGGFALALDVTPNRQAKLEAIIAQLSEEAPQQAESAPQPPRPAPTIPQPATRFAAAQPAQARPIATSELRLANGEITQARVMSIAAGVAVVATNARPPLGSTVAIGKLAGHVARHLPDGIVINLDNETLSEVMRLDRRSYFHKPGTAPDWDR